LNVRSAVNGGESHTLMHDGCDCGAEARMELTFEKDENDK